MYILRTKIIYTGKRASLPETQYSKYAECPTSFPCSKQYALNVTKAWLSKQTCNIDGQQLPTLLDVTCQVCLHTLLNVVACHWRH